MYRLAVGRENLHFDTGFDFIRNGYHRLRFESVCIRIEKYANYPVRPS